MPQVFKKDIFLINPYENKERVVSSLYIKSLKIDFPLDSSLKPEQTSQAMQMRHNRIISELLLQSLCGPLEEKRDVIGRYS